MWRKVLREYFAFPKKERQGILVLFIIWFALIIYRYYSTYNYQYADWQIQFKTDSILAIKEKDFSTKFDVEKSTFLFNKQTKILNQSNFNELKQLGLSSRTSAIIMKFINAGANLNTTEQLDKIYGINENEKKILVDNFLFTKLNFKSYDKKEIKVEFVNINTCDSSMLESLPKIGPALSSRIIKYRNKLGGFIDKKQLLEVYGLDTNVMKAVESRIIVDIRSINKIKINKASFEELLKFPYLNYKLAKVIINYRDQHGLYESKADLLKIHLMNEKIIDKLEPYIDYTNEY